MESEAAMHKRLMIAKPSIAYSDFSGTAKEVTARNVGGRNILSVRAKQSKVVTPAQAVSRNKLSKISRGYKQLSDSQMTAWEVLAKHLKGISTFGVAAEMTGHNAYVRINENRQLVGMDILSDAPVYVSDVPEVEYEDFWVTPTMILFSGIEKPKDSYKLVVRMSSGLSVGISNGWNKTVIVAPGVDEDWGDVNITRIYNNTIGFAPEIGDKVFIELYWLDSETGFVGETMRVKAIVKSDSQVEGEVYEPRNEVTLDNIVNTNLGSTFEKFAIEQADGSPIMTCDVVCHIGGIVSGVDGDIDGLPDTYVGGRSYFPARGTGKCLYGISLNESYVQWSKYWKSYQIAHRFSKYDPDFEMFGTSCMVNF